MNNRLLFIIYFSGLLLLLPSSAIYAEKQPRVTINDARSAVIDRKIDKAIKIYSQLVSESTKSKSKYSYSDISLLSEYGYVLALGQVYEGALMNLDRALMLGKADSETMFYISQTFALMEYEDIAKLFWNPSTDSVPQWLAADYKELLKKHKTYAVINQHEFREALKNANMLALDGQYLQSIVIYQELVDNYPEQSIPFVGYSALMEKLGFKSKAVELLTYGIEAMGDEKMAYNQPGIYEKHLLELKKKTPASINNTTSVSNNLLNIKEKEKTTMLVYAGGMMAKSLYSLNSRFAVFVSDKIYLSIDLGIANSKSSTNYNVGMSVYATYKWLIAGVGLSEQLTKGSSMTSIRTSVGMSVPSKSGKSSFDLLFDVYSPTGKVTGRTYGLSIGRSFYF